MKRSIFILIVAGLLMSCGHGRRHESIEFGWTPLDTVVQDTTSHETSQEGSAAGTKEDRPVTVNTGSKSSIKRGAKVSDNMRGFDPASEDDMDDNGMSRYFDNNDDEGWD